MPQILRQDAFRQELLDVPNALIAWAFKLLERELGSAIRLIELLGAFLCIPLRFELRQLGSNFFEAHAIRARIRSGIVRKFDLAVGNNTGHDLRQVPYPIVMGGLAYVEGLVEHDVRRSLERSNEGARDVFDMNDRAPWGAV